MPRDEASRTAALSATSHQGRRCAPADDALAFECRTAATFDRLRIGHLAHRLALDAIARVGCILFRVEIIRRGICSSLTCSIQSTTLPLSASAMAMCLIARCKPHDVTRLNIPNRAARALHPPSAGYHDQCLTQWMRVPRDAGARLLFSLKIARSDTQERSYCNSVASGEGTGRCRVYLSKERP
jgi:hypothetical protein